MFPTFSFVMLLINILAVAVFFGLAKYFFTVDRSKHEIFKDLCVVCGNLLPIAVVNFIIDLIFVNLLHMHGLLWNVLSGVILFVLYMLFATVRKVVDGYHNALTHPRLRFGSWLRNFMSKIIQK